MCACRQKGFLPGHRRAGSNHAVVPNHSSMAGRKNIVNAYVACCLLTTAADKTVSSLGWKGGSVPACQHACHVACLAFSAPAHDTHPCRLSRACKQAKGSSEVTEVKGKESCSYSARGTVAAWKQLRVEGGVRLMPCPKPGELSHWCHSSLVLSCLEKAKCLFTDYTCPFCRSIQVATGTTLLAQVHEEASARHAHVPCKKADQNMPP